MFVGFGDAFDDQSPPVSMLAEAFEHMSPVNSPGIDPSVAVVSFRSMGRRGNHLGEAADVLCVAGIGEAVRLVACLEFHDVLQVDVENMRSQGLDGLLTVIRGHLVQVHGVQGQPHIIFTDHL